MSVPSMVPSSSSSSLHHQSNTDCYYYYYSTCTRGSSCPYRHEPSALASEVVCSFWKKGNCTRNKCYYRHMDITHKRSTTECYWESQPGGCKKPHCPFLHQTPKEPYSNEIEQILEKPNAKIIVNKNKIEELSKLILPVKPSASSSTSPGADLDERRVVVSRKSLSVKDRLGTPMNAGVGVKTRLGGLQREGEDQEGIEVYEYSDPGEDEVGSEEEELRASAIKTLDLRARLSGTKRTREHFDERDEEEEEIDAHSDDENLAVSERKKIKSTVHKVKKEKKKEKREKKKKKEKKKEKEKRTTERSRPKPMNIGVKALKALRVNINQDAGNDEEKAIGRRIVKRVASDQDESLASRVASKRAKSASEKPVLKRLGDSSGLAREETSPSPSPPPTDRKTRKAKATKVDKKQTAETEKPSALKTDHEDKEDPDKSIDILKEMDALLEERASEDVKS